MENKPNVVISTDGACSGNPGPGGYAAILCFGSKEKEICGYDPKTTNNRMELKAVIEGVKALKCPCNITIRTDSHYIITGMTNAKEWSKNNWRKKSGGRCANSEMWQELTEIGKAGHHHFQYLYVEGHSGDPYNERCDKLAKEQIRLNAR